MKLSIKKSIGLFLTTALILTMSAGIALAGTDFSYSASSVRDVDPDDPDTGDDGAEFTVRFREADGEVLENEDVVFYVSSDRDTENLDMVSDYDELDEIIDNEVWRIEAETDGDGEVVFEVYSSIPGGATIEVGDWDEEDEEMRRTVRRGSQDIHFGSEDITDLYLEVDERYPRVGEDFILTVEAFDGNFESGEGLDIVIKEEKDDDDFEEIETIETDEDGIAELRLDQSQLGDYRYKAIYEGDDDDVESDTVVVNIDEVGDIDRIEAYQDTKFVEDGQDDFEVFFALYDEYENKVPDTDEVVITVTDPDGDTYDRDNREVSLAVEDDEDEDTYNMFVVEVDQDRIDLLGTYEIEARVSGTTIRDSIDVTVSKFGDVDDLELELSEETAVVDDADDDDYYGEVYLIDEDDLKRKYDTDDEEIIFSTDSYSVAGIDRDTGDITIRGEGEAEISAYHKETGLEATATLVVGDQAEDIEIESNIEPGSLSGEVKMTYVDEDGRRAHGEGGYVITRNDDVEVTNEEDFDSGRATFDVEVDSFGTYELRAITDEGVNKTFEITFSEEKEEEYDLTFIVEDEDKSTVEGAKVSIDGNTYETDMIGYVEISNLEAGYQRYTVEADGYETYKGSITLSDDTDKVITLSKEDSASSQNIIMSLDERGYLVDGEEKIFEVAPRAIDGRTFLPFRTLGETMGAYVEYNQADQSVIATRDDRRVVFYLGEKTAYVNDEEFVMDTKPFVDDDLGRTLLPLRFFADAFDAYVEYEQSNQQITIKE
ncbi:stalk domain-containing protein [Natranaerobius trueperi]|uniref:Copper amine oxidase-like N-terminal domain-containing protein n=1 Tax=Natranaerobius trueperi TaxID=759412 RepID=A0A226BWG6_9FIRM|nr:stalk domain-containing protein [Natranaerobius trueperi]OWZ83343.1 hypothetical protein CDO51_08985 [Natranaerobius trueperi]